MAQTILKACVFVMVVIGRVSSSDRILAQPPQRNAPVDSRVDATSGFRSPSSARTLSISDAEARSSMQWLADLLVRKLPSSFDGEKDWGRTKRVWAGVKIRRDGFQLKTNRRYRQVEHGRWIRYELARPAAKAATSVLIDSVARIAEGHPASDTEDGWRIESTILAPMRFTARLERWNYGWKWYSVSVTGNFRVRLRSALSIRFIPDYTAIPPALVIDPRVDAAALELESFEVERISKVGGDVAEAWGEIVQGVIRERIRRHENPRLSSKLNRAIENHRDDLRLSMFDSAAGWLKDSD